MMRFIHSSFVVLLTVSGAFAQWSPKGIGLLPANYYVAQIQVVNDQVIWATAIEATGQTPDDVLFLLRSTDGGENWDTVSVPPSKGHFPLDFMATGEQDLYISSYLDNFNTFIFHSTDGAITWNTIMPAAIQSIPNFLRALSSNDLVAYGYSNSSISSNGGSTWNPVTPPALESNEYFTSVSSTNTMATASNAVWVPTSKGRVFRSSNKGATWDAVNTPLYPSMILTTAAFSDDMSGMVASSFLTDFSLVQTQVAVSMNSGDTWDQKTAPRALTCLSAVPEFPGAFVAVSSETTQPGSMYTLDYGDTWMVMDTVGIFNAVAFYNNAVGFVGNGSVVGPSSPAMYKWEGSPLGVSNVDRDVFSINVYPNPAHTLVAVSFSSAATDKAMVNIVNALGQVVLSSEFETGDKHALLDVSSLSVGVYMLRVSGVNAVAEKLCIIR